MNRIKKYFSNFFRISRVKKKTKNGAESTGRVKIGTVGYFVLLMIYLEVAFHIIMFGGIGIKIIYPIVFAVGIGIIFGIITSLFPKIVNHLLTIFLTGLMGFMFGAQMIYYNVFSTFFALFGVFKNNVAGQALDFMDIIWSTIFGNLGSCIVLLIIPLLFALFVTPLTVNYSRLKPLYIVNYLICTGEAFLVFALLLLIGGTSDMTAYDLFVHSTSVDAATRDIGVLSTTVASFRDSYIGRNTRTTIADETLLGEESVSSSEEVDESAGGYDVTVNGAGSYEITIDLPAADTYGKNIFVNLNFDKILEASGGSSDVETLCNYFSSQSGTNKNEYTGMFEGYNLIWVTAEGLDYAAITSEWTPTLYKMMTEGFYFKNYFSPVYYGSTSGGEWVNLTGLIPNNGSYVSMEESGEVGLNMLFTAGRQCTRLGYHCEGWHNNSYTYYGRSKSFPNMGYDWHGTDQGYEPETNDSGKAYWPQSDIHLIEESFDSYSSSTPFLTYYITVSGHVQYSFSGNYIAYKNKSLVEDLPYSEKAQAYIACQMELDKAMELLLSDLEEAGLSDNTLIVLAPDHVPYNDMDIVDELLGSEQDDINAYRNCLMIYSPSMEEAIEVDKYCCSADILPTVSNLMGWDYDSRLIVGSDILSDSDQFVKFPNNSFISEECIYNASNGQITSLTGTDPDDDYISAMKNKAYNCQTISDLIFSTDFYKYVEEQIYGG